MPCLGPLVNSGGLSHPSLPPLCTASVYEMSPVSQTQLNPKYGGREPLPPAPRHREYFLDSPILALKPASNFLGGGLKLIKVNIYCLALLNPPVKLNPPVTRLVLKTENGDTKQKITACIRARKGRTYLTISFSCGRECSIYSQLQTKKNEERKRRTPRVEHTQFERNVWATFLDIPAAIVGFRGWKYPQLCGGGKYINKKKKRGRCSWVSHLFGKVVERMSSLSLTRRNPTDGELTEREIKGPGSVRIKSDMGIGIPTPHIWKLPFVFCCFAPLRLHILV